MKPYRSLCMIFLWIAIGAEFRTLAHAQTGDFHLHDGDTVVFYGDSITEQSYYTQFVQLYTQTRFPHMHLRYFNAGVGGDKVSGGSGGTVDTRLTRDVISHKPTVVTMMFGMNDGRYESLNAEIADTYRKGYEHILNRLRKELPGVRITILGPTPLDEVTRPEMVRGSYNRSLLEFGEIGRQLAKQYDASFIDLNAPVLSALKKASAIDPLAAELIIPDRIHPSPIVHWIVAATILEGWNAPGVVTAATIDGNSLQATDLVRTRVTDVKRAGEKITWTELDDALPLPFVPDADMLFLGRISDVGSRLNSEILQIPRLNVGLYKLVIDGTSMGSFTDEEFAHGINLSNYKTPMREQAQAASWVVRDYSYATFTHNRLLIDEIPMSQTQRDGDAALRAFEDIEQKKIDGHVQPLPHQFEVEPDKR